MRFLDDLLAWAGFVLISGLVLAAPWFFGAWEMWYFWPFAVAIFLSTVLFACRFLAWGMMKRARRRRLGAQAEAESERERAPETPRFSGMAALAALSALPFLLYAFVRFQQAPVFMDAERSFLLYLTPFLLGMQIVFGFNSRQRNLLYVFIAADLGLLGLYGIVNHYELGPGHGFLSHVATGNKYVLWLPGYEQYQMGVRRATGSYFCPDHFSGLMELALCGALGLLMARERRWFWKAGGTALLAVGLLGVVLSKSRGGGLTAVVVAVAALVWGFAQWRVLVRWYHRLCVGMVLVIALVVFWKTGDVYVERFTGADGWGSGRIAWGSFEEMKGLALKRFSTTSRGMMILGAWRAWKTNRKYGIGPGMHQNLWPHFAASPDGDRELGKWPSQPNYTFHSYEVHSDWMQLLEEYGAAGLALFLAPAGMVLGILMLGLYRETQARRWNDWEATGREDHAALLTGVLALAAMAFHSLGDFNLQIPATTWLFASMLALALAHVVRVYPAAARRRHPEESE